MSISSDAPNLFVQVARASEHAEAERAALPPAMAIHLNAIDLNGQEFEALLSTVVGLGRVVSDENLPFHQKSASLAKVLGINSAGLKKVPADFGAKKSPKKQLEYYRQVLRSAQSELKRVAAFLAERQDAEDFSMASIAEQEDWTEGDKAAAYQREDSSRRNMFELENAIIVVENLMMWCGSAPEAINPKAVEHFAEKYSGVATLPSLGGGLMVSAATGVGSKAR